jgi:5-methylcytosine-specific restriction enzyme subunit McrC
MSSIPIQNIYYLLCYAWNKLDEKDRVSVSIDDKTQLLDLFAKVLISASKVLLKRGIDSSYREYDEAIPGIKGKLNLTSTLKANLLRKQRTICTFDEFSFNVLLNQILVTTLYRLSKTKGLDRELTAEIIALRRMFPNIDMIELQSSLFRKIRLNRDNRFYGFIMHICELIYDNTLPSEKQGSLLFSDFTRDERKMNRLFEAFIRNFYKLEQKRFSSVGSEIIEWKFHCDAQPAVEYLPQMRTDITLQNDTEKIIIDAKYYTETMTINFDTEKIRSTNLYQLFSYLLNQEDEADLRTKTATGILLYPTIETDYDLRFQYKQHEIQIRTVNLNSNWRELSRRLKEIVGVP